MTINYLAKALMSENQYVISLQIIAKENLVIET